MKLRSCHIENFGIYSNKDFDFNTNLFSLYGENGEGKSTLTSFILAMLYGMDTVSSKSKDFKDREHYYPFQGGNFGGNLVLEVDNKEYRIEAMFDSKSNTKDSIRLLDNSNHEISLNGKTVGEYLFNVNKDTFTSTIFISANRLDINMSTDIATKLSNLIDVNSSSKDYEKAINKLDDLQKSKNKEIKEIKSKINGFEEESNKKQAEYDNYSIKENELLEAKKAKDKAKKILDDAYKMSDIKLAYDKLDAMKKDLENYKTKKKEIDDKYKDGFLSDNDIDTIRNNKSQISSLNAASSFTELDNEKLNCLKEFFKDNIPSVEETKDIANQVKEYNESKIILESNKSEFDDDLAKKFDGKDISVEKFNNEIEPLVKRLENINPIAQTNNKKMNLPTLVCMILGGLLFVSGIVFIALSKLIIGIILSLVGVVALIASLFVYMNGGKNNIQDPYENERIKINEQLQNVLSTYFYKTMPVLTNINALGNDLKKYEELKAKCETYKEKTDDLEKRLDEIKDNLNRYNVNYSDVLDNPLLIETNLKSYQDLIQKETQAQKANDEIVSKRQYLEKEIDDIFNKYKISKEEDLDGQLKSFNSLNYEYSNYVKAIEKLEKDIPNFKQENNLTEKPDFIEQDMEALNNDYNKKNEAYQNVEKEIKLLDETKEALDRITQTIERCNEEVEELSIKERLYKNTLDSLKNAKAALIQKYVKPIKEGYEKYAQKLSAVLASNPTMDENLNVTFEANGLNRTSKHFSDGQKSLSNLCIRLALIDEMYKNECPFVVLDDPFVSLDEKNIELVNGIIKNIFTDKQVLYLYCHKSREIK